MLVARGEVKRGLFIRGPIGIDTLAFVVSEDNLCSYPGESLRSNFPSAPIRYEFEPP